MYTTHCEDPNCVKCQQASKGQSSKEGNQSKIPETSGQSSEDGSQKQLLETVDEVIAKDMLSAAVARGRCLSTCSMLKEVVHNEFDALMNILKERELDLCIEIEKECCAQLLKIDHDVTANCVDKIMKRYDENKRPRSKTMLIFDSDSAALKRRLKCFGKLRYEDAEVVSKRWMQELRESIMADDADSASSSGSPIGVGSKATSGAENSTPVSFVDPFEGDYKTTFSATNTSLMSDLAKFKNMNRLRLKDFIREAEEQNRRLNKISLESEKDSKINFNDKLSEDLENLRLKEFIREVEEQNCRLKKISLESEKDSKINFNDKLSEDLENLLFKDVKRASEEQSCWLKEVSLANEEDFKIKYKDEHSKDPRFGWKSRAATKLYELSEILNESLKKKTPAFMQMKKGLEAIASGTMKDKKRDLMTYRGFESTDSVPNKDFGMDSESKRSLELVHNMLLREINAEEIADRLSAGGIAKCGEDNSLKKGLEAIASRTMKDKKRDLMTYRGFESTDSVPNKDFGMDSESKRSLELVHNMLLREISAEEIADRLSAGGIAKCGEDNSLGKDTAKIKTLHQQLTGKDEPETLSAQIKKRFEVLANRTMNDQKREKMACRGFENTDSVPNKDFGMDSSSLQEEIRQFESQQELLKKDFKELWAKLPATDLKDKIASQGSGSTDSSSSEEVEKDSSLDEDDIEIISRIETESIPSELSFSPPLPPKNRFKFGRKPSCFGSLLRKKEGVKPAHSPRDSAKSESSGIGGSESQESSLIGAVSSGSNPEMKENPSFDEQSSSECLGGSKDEGRDINPTAALRSSFMRYLEKNPASEWLAPGKSSEQSLSAGIICKERIVSYVLEDFDHWLPIEDKTSDWLHPAHM